MLRVQYLELKLKFQCSLRKEFEKSNNMKWEKNSLEKQKNLEDAGSGRNVYYFFFLSNKLNNNIIFQAVIDRKKYLDFLFSRCENLFYLIYS